MFTRKGIQLMKQTNQCIIVIVAINKTVECPGRNRRMNMMKLFTCYFITSVTSKGNPRAHFAGPIYYFHAK